MCQFPAKWLLNFEPGKGLIGDWVSESKKIGRLYFAIFGNNDGAFRMPSRLNPRRDFQSALGSVAASFFDLAPGPLSYSFNSAKS